MRLLRWGLGATFIDTPLFIIIWIIIILGH